MHHLTFILFLFALGACVGSFLNVVVWRLPRGVSVISPPSHCPKCEHRLAWRDNIPILGWILLRGRCRYCASPISIRYPTIEFITGALFVFYYVMFFMLHIGPCAPQQVYAGLHPILETPQWVERLPESIFNDWPIYLLYMAMIACLLAVSLIDIELFIIPATIPWGLAGFAMLIHALADHPAMPGALNLVPRRPGVPPDGIAAALAAGGGVGFLLSLLLSRAGKFPQSFPEGEPALEIDEELYQAELEKARREKTQPPKRPPVYTRSQIRREILKEIPFLLPPLLLSLLAFALTQYIPAIHNAWLELMKYHWLTGLLGSLLGAMVGGLVIWLARILGTLGFGKVAMGLGDADLMFGIGAVVGAGAATVTFFLAPFAGLVIGLWRLLFRGKWQLPYGPYLSFAAALVLLVYCPIANWLAPGFEGVGMMLNDLLGGAP